MKNIIIIISLFISGTYYSQLAAFNTTTWLYQYSKSETYTNEWDVPYSTYLFKGSSFKYSIYYAKDDYWEFVGSIAPQNISRDDKVYFKNGYKVAYAKDDEKPIKIEFTTKKWKVE